MAPQPMTRQEQDRMALQLIGLTAAATVIGGVLYLLIAVQTLIVSGELPPFIHAVWGAVRVPGHMSDPAEAFDPALARLLPGPTAFWALIITVIAAATATVAWVLVRVDRLKSRQHLALRPYDPRSKITPRAFARPRDLKDLRTGNPDSWTTIRLDGRMIGTAPETHVLLIAPTGSGKTTGPVTTWTLEHRGPLIVTSTKTDIAQLTIGARAQQGPVWVYAPGVNPSVLPIPACGWTPLAGCEDWEHAQMTGHWLASNTPIAKDDSGGARFYNKEASRLLAPLLHAAAIAGHDMATVNDWLRSESGEVGALLDNAGARAARAQLESCRRMEGRARSLTIASAGQLIDAYELRSIQTSDHDDFTPGQLLDANGTLYLIAPEDRQERVAPLFAALLGSIFRTVEQRSLTAPLQPQLRVVLDETRRLAALDQLPGLLSVSRGWGVRIATVWQNLDQIADRYGRQANEILTNSNAHLFLGPIRDRGTRDHLTALLGSHPTDQISYDIDGLGNRHARTATTTDRDKLTAQTLQQLPRGHALLIHGDDPPAKGRVLAHWQSPQLTRLITDGNRRLHQFTADPGSTSATPAPPRRQILENAAAGGRLVARERQHQNVSVRQLAWRTGLPATLIRDIEAQRVEPTVQQLADLLNALGRGLDRAPDGRLAIRYPPPYTTDQVRK